MSISVIEIFTIAFIFNFYLQIEKNKIKMKMPSYLY